MSWIFVNFATVNQHIKCNYGKTENTCCDIHRRTGERTQKKDAFHQNGKNTEGENPDFASSRHRAQQGIFLRGDRKEIRHISEFGQEGGQRIRRGRLGASASYQQESEIRYSQQENGWQSGGGDYKNSLWPVSGRTCTLDLATSCRTGESSFGRAGEQGHNRTRFKKNKIRPHKNTYWCIPQKGSGEFVAKMEDVLDVYERPYDKDYPVVCVDELPYEMHGEAREPLQARAGSDRKDDFEYVRCGTCSVFGAIEPLTGNCIVEVKEHRTKKDLAVVLKRIAGRYQDAKKIVLIWDNLNTHNTGSLYEAFSALEAHDLANRFEIHFTPKHGSWLNVAEILLNILTKQCLKRRLDSIEKVRSEIEKWVTERNSKPVKVNWQFRTPDARIKLKSLYPEI